MSFYGNGGSLCCCMQMAIIPRPPVGHGWLRPAIGVVELSQSIVQVSFSRDQYSSERLSLVSTALCATVLTRLISIFLIVFFSFSLFQQNVRKLNFVINCGISSGVP